MTDEWRFPNRATPLGSSAYYSLRFAPRGIRDDLAVLLAWHHQVRAVLDQVSDPGVARLKLQWWQDELAHTLAGAPRHPLTKALQPVLERHELPQVLLADIADQVESEVLHEQPADQDDLDAACDRDLGALFELVAHCHGVSDAALLQTARRLGGFCAQVYLIRNSGALARRGRVPLPTERLRKQGLSAAALTRREHRTHLPDLLAPAATHARKGLAQLKRSHDLPVCIRARASILESLLDEIERADFDVAGQRIGLPPLRKLWIAWRESRR